jgi:hypothetical protein
LDVVGHEVEVVVEIEGELAARVERDDFREAKEEAREKLQQCVDTIEQGAAKT